MVFTSGDTSRPRRATSFARMQLQGLVGLEGFEPPTHGLGSGTLHHDFRNLVRKLVLIGHLLRIEVDIHYLVDLRLIRELEAHFISSGLEDGFALE